MLNPSWYLAKSASCLGSERSRPGIPPTGIFFPKDRGSGKFFLNPHFHVITLIILLSPVMYSV